MENFIPKHSHKVSVISPKKNPAKTFPVKNIHEIPNRKHFRYVVASVDLFRENFEKGVTCINLIYDRVVLAL